jgi:hypothetical protein
MLLHVQYVLPLLAALAPCCAGAFAPWGNVTFPTPTPEPGVNQGGQQVISGGMPIGNGETTGLVFSLAEPLTVGSGGGGGFRLDRGVHVWLRMTTAMASDMSLMSLGVVSIVTDPPLTAGSFYQTLHLNNATVEVISEAGKVEVWVDAHTNRVSARVRSSSSPMHVWATVTPLRPTRRFAYAARCFNATSEGDVLFSNIPGANNSLGVSHRNVDVDLTTQNKPGMFNTTLQQQGLGEYASKLQAGDRWRHRQFGLVVSGPGFVLEKRSSSRSSSSSSSSGSGSGSGGGSGSIVASDVRVATLTITTLSRQTDSSQVWVDEIAKLHVKDTAAHSSRAAHDTFWESFWDKSHIWVSSAATKNDDARQQQQLDALTQRYAQTRYVQAIQAGTWVPIKFNGMTFTAQLPPNATFRSWGSSNWWQNTRLAYWNMAAAGDVAQLRTIFDYYLQMLPLLETRTQAAFNHSGIYTTETKTLFGLYDPCDYGTSAASRSTSDLNFGYEESRYLKFDFGGNAGLTEISVMLLDYYAYTLDDAAMAEYMPLLAGTLDFFAKHYGDVERAPKTKLTIFPAQALETYQCPTWPATSKNCPTNDHPTVAALHVLTERAQELPTRFSTDAQRAQWKALAEALPAVPMTTANDDGASVVVSPYETFSTTSTRHVSNSETPELYSTHPFRYFTLGRSLLSGTRKRDIAPSIYCLEKSKRETCRNADRNGGWVQGLLNAALLGRAKKASTDTLARAQTAPAKGYRFPGFAQHEQDYEPSEDHLANMNTALQLMLMSPADDGLEDGGALLFPAWPCSWNVDFKLMAPRNTVVSGSFVGGQLVELAVVPEARRSAIRVMACQDA